MKFNKLTMGLAAVGVVSLASAARADETKMTQVQTALSNTTLSGYVDVAAQWNLGSQNGGPTPGSRGIIANEGGAKNDGFSLNAVDLTLDKPLDESPWAAGYHIEFQVGPDAVGGFVRQGYLALRTPVANSGIDWKIGVWDTIIGYESSSDPLNPNYTRSFGYTMEPTTHTGILATYKINDMVSVSAGVADSSNVGIGGVVAAPGGGGINARNAMESQKAYMGSVTFTAPDSAGFMKGATMSAGIIDNTSSKGTGAGTHAGTTSLYAGVTVPTPLEKLKVGAAFDWLDAHNGQHNGGGATDSSIWNVGLYANFQANDKLSFNVRGEHAEPNVNAIVPSADEFTATVQYALWANVLSRVEFRWDHLEHGTAPGGGAIGFDSSPYGLSNLHGTGIHDNAYMLALNLIYQF